MARDNLSWTDWLGKRGLYWSRNPSAYAAKAIAIGIVDITVRSMNYRIQKPGGVGFKTYSFEGLRVAVASGEVQLDWKARCNSKERTVREARFRRATNAAKRSVRWLRLVHHAGPHLELGNHHWAPQMRQGLRH